MSGLFTRCTAAFALCAAAASSLQAQEVKVLSLAQALETARAHAPELHQARARETAARARVDSARAPLLPQVTGNASYERGTKNTPAQSSTATQDNWSFGLSATQLVYDFGQTRGQHKAAKASAEASADATDDALLQLELNVRVAYFVAAAQKALLGVARETLDNREQRLRRIEAFVDVGTRPAIDLAQSRTDVASSRLAVLRAENAYALAKASLTRSMGAPGPSDFEVASELLGPIDGEDAPPSTLLAQAVKARPDLAALSSQVRAQELSLAAIEGNYWPSLSIGAGVSEGGRYLDDLAWNARGGVTLSWGLFQGDITHARANEARATLLSLRAQLDAARKDVALLLEQAWLDLQTARAAVAAADEIVANAREQLRLAEGRYDAGAGHVIELSDAQLAVSNAQTERVRADYDLSTARARLLAALGRSSR